jgi:exoribonuclease II
MSNSTSHPDLRAIARQAMLDRGFAINTPVVADAQLEAEAEPPFESLGLRDLRAWLWSSIDNDDSKDLDQIEYAARDGNGIRVYVGVADVDWFVPLRSPLDRVAAQNTTSVYTGVETFPMLPGRLSTDLSSLNEGEVRLAIVIEMLVDVEGRVAESSIYSAVVLNKAQLTYDAVAAWLDKDGGSQEEMTLSEAGSRTLRKIEASPELQDQLRMQDRAAELLRTRRHEVGALTFHTRELQPVMSDGSVIDLGMRERNRASYIIEDFMVRANQVTSEFLDGHHSPSMRRVVREPKRWDRIVALASSLGTTLPPEPDVKSLEAFLKAQQKGNPSHFEELSFTVIKLLGRGEYILKSPGREAPGHFSLAVENYSHSTAPNRRYPDLVTQRLLKAVLAGKQSPYSNDDLQAIAKHCTDKEDDANKVERLVKKCAAAVLMGRRIGEVFEASVSGVTRDGTWVRLFHPPVEGKLEGKVPPLDVGHRVRVRLVATDPQRGFIDFELIRNPASA